MEWKDFDYSEKIYKSVEKILIDKFDDLKKTFQNNAISPKVSLFMKHLIRLFEFTYLLSSTGIFKKFLISDQYLTVCFDLF